LMNVSYYKPEQSYYKQDEKTLILKP